METSTYSSGKSAKIELSKDLLVLGISYAAVSLWSLAASRFVLSSLIALPGLYGASLLLYAQLHRHYHAYSKSALPYHTIGIAYSALAGLSWILYCSHHANHHRYNNGQGDWSKTTDSKGNPIIGWKYILREALRPFFLQLIPFLSLFGMKPSKRNSLAVMDECSRVLFRALAYVCFGVYGLVALLVWQLIFVFAIIYLNYLQHFGIEEGNGAVWNPKLFNRLTDQLGYHDQHHRYPSYADRMLPNISSRIAESSTTSLFSFKAMILFLFNTEGLAKHLQKKTKSR